MYVLLVDDSDIITGSIKKLLKDNQKVARLDRADSVTKGMTMIRQQQPDVVILDISLPDGNGIDMLKWIKGNYPHIYVIMFSNNSDSVNRVISQEYGADQFFDKSTEFEMINDVIEKLNIV